MDRNAGEKTWKTTTPRMVGAGEEVYGMDDPDALMSLTSSRRSESSAMMAWVRLRRTRRRGGGRGTQTAPEAAAAGTTRMGLLRNSGCGGRPNTISFRSCSSTAEMKGEDDPPLPPTRDNSHSSSTSSPSAAPDLINSSSSSMDDVVVVYGGAVAGGSSSSSSGQHRTRRRRPTRNSPHNEQHRVSTGSSSHEKLIRHQQRQRFIRRLVQTMLVVISQTTRSAIALALNSLLEVLFFVLSTLFDVVEHTAVAIGENRTLQWTGNMVIRLAAALIQLTSHRRTRPAPEKEGEETVKPTTFGTKSQQLSQQLGPLRLRPRRRWTADHGGVSSIATPSSPAEAAAGLFRRSLPVQLEQRPDTTTTFVKNTTTTARRSIFRRKVSPSSSLSG
jgi:hypothetical protein